MNIRLSGIYSNSLAFTHFINFTDSFEAASVYSFLKRFLDFSHFEFIVISLYQEDILISSFSKDNSGGHKDD